MAVLGRATFEVQVHREGRWAINEVLSSEEAARAKAQSLLTQKGVAGVKIIKETKFSETNVRESEIFCQMKEAEDSADYSITPVEAAPLCEQVADYYQTAARNTMARIFSKYIEKQELTPLELLHSHKNLKRMLNIDSMVPSAVDKIASLHARATGGDSRKRKDMIWQAVERIGARAREADSKQLPELKNSTLDEMLARIDAKFPDPEERTYMANVAFARATTNWQGWLAKMANLLPIAKSQKDERARAMVDEMMADIFVSKSVIKDVIGVSKHLGDAVLRIVDLMQGKCQPTKFATEDLLELLNSLFAADLLPRSKKVLFERIQRDLDSPVRLTNSEDPNGDKVFYDQVLDRLVGDHGVIGGRPVATGLTGRWARLSNIGGATGFKRATEAVRDKLTSGKRKFVYLLAMYDPDVDPNLKAMIEGQVRDLAAQLNTIQKIAPEARTEKARLQEAAAIQRLVLDSKLEARTRDPLANKFDDLVSDYIISQGVIERLDDKRLPFRERASRLVTFCASGVLTIGRATTIARDIVVGYLRRKDFITEYTADIPEPSEKEKAIKEFYTLLSRTGFEVR
ncbi:MAG: hypothetical protein K1X51_03455 [Rhodospirillaceae bacterium]|nr:hypothetical protein [Rhodospirillaceae bacterium]